MPCRYDPGMTRPTLRPGMLPVAAFSVWTLFVWVQRVVNIFGGGTLHGTDLLGALVRPVVFSAIGIVLALVAFGPIPAERTKPLVVAGGGITIAMWLVQTVLIATRDYSVGFIVVHVVLGVVSVGLAVWAMRSVAGPAGAVAARPS